MVIVGLISFRRLLRQRRRLPRRFLNRLLITAGPDRNRYGSAEGLADDQATILRFRCDCADCSAGAFVLAFESCNSMTLSRWLSQRKPGCIDRGAGSSC
jgi:hypothetical protein